MAIARKPVKTSNPDYGRRLLPHLIDERARNSHERPYASVSVSKDPKDGFRDISYEQFANAINRCAQWLLDQIGHSQTFEILAYMGPQDLRYQVLVIAAIKTGRAGKVLAFSGLWRRTQTLIEFRCSSHHRETVLKHISHC